MKFLILLLSCSTCLAQFPYSGTAWSSASGLGDYTNFMYADFQTDTTRSLSSAYVNGNIVVYWTNISPVGPDRTGSTWSLITSSGVWPYYTNNVTPTGKGALEFINNNGSTGANQPNMSAGGSNQPNTFVMCVRFVGVDGSITDASSGGREIIGRSGGQYSMFSGVGFNVGTVISSNFMILTGVHNGANSYVRTNGVLVGTGNSGTGGLGVLIVGDDQTGATPFKGQIAALRIYAQAMNTNDLHTAEQNLATRYLGITLPSP